jgi:hypothetical protein
MFIVKPVSSDGARSVGAQPARCAKRLWDIEPACAYAIGIAGTTEGNHIAIDEHKRNEVDAEIGSS